MLAYTPLLDPINLFHEWWFVLLIPMSLGVSIAYKAVRLPTLYHFWKHVLAMTAQIIVGMILLAVASYIIIEGFIPMIVGE